MNSANEQSSYLHEWLAQLRSHGTARPETVEIETWGRTHRLIAMDEGADTVVLEERTEGRFHNRDPMLLIPKSALQPGAHGYICTLTSGNHAVAAMALLCGKLWDLAEVAPERRSHFLAHQIVCGNLLHGGDAVELSQREVATCDLVRADDWLQRQGWPLDRVVMADRVDATLEHYRKIGQEWRIKPLAWTRAEMLSAIQSSRKSMHSRLTYYHSVKGIHLLTVSQFRFMLSLVESDPDAFRECLAELAGWMAETNCSMMRNLKFQAHHEIEFFGLRPGVAEAWILPRIEQLHHDVETGNGSAADILAAGGEIERIYVRDLVSPELRVETSDRFLETLYKHLTGAVYLGDPDEITPAFDDRKTALPGATFVEGNPIVHPGADERSLAILDYVRSILSHGESVNYVNIYEIRGAGKAPLGEGLTREIVFATNHRPLPQRLIEKRLAHRTTGYGDYTLARVNGFRALGISYGHHHLLARRDRRAGEIHYYIRDRYPGEPFNAIPKSRFRCEISDANANPDAEDPEVVTVLATLLGEAAAENMILKKFRFEDNPNRFGIGKEIVEFGYDVHRMRELPLRVYLCSVRGTMGWPDISCTKENLRRMFDFYLRSFATTLVSHYRRHADAVSLATFQNAFLEGFASKTREVYWNYCLRREAFDEFDPSVESRYDFLKQWRFALWSLCEQRNRLNKLQFIFRQCVAQVLSASTEPAE